MQDFEWMKILPFVAYMAYNVYKGITKKEKQKKPSVEERHEVVDAWSRVQSQQAPPAFSVQLNSADHGELPCVNEPSIHTTVRSPAIRRRPRKSTLRRMLRSKMIFERKYFEV